MTVVVDAPRHPHWHMAFSLEKVPNFERLRVSREIFSSLESEAFWCRVS